MGKSRVAPAKLVTVLHLELTAASLSVRVGYMLQNELSFEKRSEVSDRFTICFGRHKK